MSGEADAPPLIVSPQKATVGTFLFVAFCNKEKRPHCCTDSPNPRKYWSVLKARLRKSGSELTTVCSQLKLRAADGKRYATDCIPSEHITSLVRAITSKKADHFLDWFTYSDNTIAGLRWGAQGLVRWSR